MMWISTGFLEHVSLSLLNLRRISSCNMGWMTTMMGIVANLQERKEQAIIEKEALNFVG